jgi:hypothetical protein
VRSLALLYRTLSFVSTLSWAGQVFGVSLLSALGALIGAVLGAPRYILGLYALGFGIVGVLVFLSARIVSEPRQRLD